jgi:N-methylhydantoinase B
VLDEYVSVRGAHDDYGVVLTGSAEELDLAVNVAATGRLRADMRAARRPA